MIAVLLTSVCGCSLLIRDSKYISDQDNNWKQIKVDTYDISMLFGDNSRYNYETSVNNSILTVYPPHGITFISIGPVFLPVIPIPKSIPKSITSDNVQVGISYRPLLENYGFIPISAVLLTEDNVALNPIDNNCNIMVDNMYCNYTYQIKTEVFDNISIKISIPGSDNVVRFLKLKSKPKYLYSPFIL